jgi:hypothetical protein
MHILIASLGPILLTNHLTVTQPLYAALIEMVWMTILRWRFITPLGESLFNKKVAICGYSFTANH